MISIFSYSESDSDDDRSTLGADDSDDDSNQDNKSYTDSRSFENQDPIENSQIPEIKSNKLKKETTISQDYNTLPRADMIKQFIDNSTLDAIDGYKDNKISNDGNDKPSNVKMITQRETKSISKIPTMSSRDEIRSSKKSNSHSEDDLLQDIKAKFDLNNKSNMQSNSKLNKPKGMNIVKDISDAKRDPVQKLSKTIYDYENEVDELIAKPAEHSDVKEDKEINEKLLRKEHSNENKKGKSTLNIKSLKLLYIIFFRIYHCHSRVRNNLIFILK